MEFSSFQLPPPLLDYIDGGFGEDQLRPQVRRSAPLASLGLATLRTESQQALNDKLNDSGFPCIEQVGSQAEEFMMPLRRVNDKTKKDEHTFLRGSGAFSFANSMGTSLATKSTKISTFCSSKKEEHQPLQLPVQASSQPQPQPQKEK